MDFEHYLNLHKSGNLIEAEKGYRILLKKRKINPNIFTSLGLICNQTGRENESVDFFKKAVDANPYDELALNNLGLIFFKNKKHKKAKIFFTQTVEIQPNYALAFVSLATVNAELKEYEKAVSNYQKAIEIQPNHSYANSNLLFNICWSNNNKVYLIIQSFFIKIYSLKFPSLSLMQSVLL